MSGIWDRHQRGWYAFYQRYDRFSRCLWSDRDNARGIAEMAGMDQEVIVRAMNLIQQETPPRLLPRLFDQRRGIDRDRFVALMPRLLKRCGYCDRFAPTFVVAGVFLAR